MSVTAEEIDPIGPIPPGAVVIYGGWRCQDESTTGAPEGGT
jgi:hypothetical protein